ncbi:MAG: hypothetical protein AAFP02_21340 [Bacteroidota bacterium]
MGLPFFVGDASQNAGTAWQQGSALLLRNSVFRLGVPRSGLPQNKANPIITDLHQLRQKEAPKEIFQQQIIKHKHETKAAPDYQLWKMAGKRKAVIHKG